VANASVTFSVSPRAALTLKSVSGEPACTPASSTTSVTCPSDQFGNAYVDVVAGTGISQPSVNFTVAGCSICRRSFSYNIQAAPNVTSVSDSAAGRTSVAPGSYVSVYGTGLSNFTDNNDGTIDALAGNGTYTVLPLHIDYVSVTFDVPSAGISVPA